MISMTPFTTILTTAHQGQVVARALFSSYFLTLRLPPVRATGSTL